MLEHRPVLKERLLACAVFGAIAVGVVAASDTLVTGGFDFPSTDRGAHADTPNYFQIAARDLSESFSAQAHAQTWNEQYATEAEYTSYAPEDLAGAAESTDAQYRGPSEEELRREISEMYAALPSANEAQPEQAYAEDDNYSTDHTYDDAYSDDAYEEPVNEKEPFNASGNASPW